MRNKIAMIMLENYVNDSRIYKESQTLSTAGYDVKIFGIWNENLSQYQKEGDVTIERLRFPVLELVKFPLHKRKSLLPMFTLKMLLNLAKFRPDFIHCVNLFTLHIGFLAKVILGTPYVYDSHELFVEDRAARLRTLFRKMIVAYEGFLSNHAGKVIQTSTSRKALFKKYYNIDAEVIMNKALIPVKSEESASDILQSLKRKKRIVGCIGIIMPNRGIEQLAEAAEGLENIEVVLLGKIDGARGRKIFEKYKKNVTWIPPVPPNDVIATIKHFDIGVSLTQNSCLSDYLECQTKVFELVMAGIPQIASDFPEIRKVVVNNAVGPVGRVINPADVKQLRRALVEMMDNANEKEKYKENCIKMRSECNWHAEGEKLVNIYHLLRQ